MVAVNCLNTVTYAQVIRSFALVPLACFVLFVGLVLLITFAWAPLPDFPHSNVLYPYQPHARAFLVGAAGWIVAYSSRGAIYALVTLGGRWASLTSVVLSTVLSGEHPWSSSFCSAEQAYSQLQRRKC